MQPMARTSCLFALLHGGEVCASLSLSPLSSVRELARTTTLAVPQGDVNRDSPESQLPLLYCLLGTQSPRTVCSCVLFLEGSSFTF